MTRSSRASSSVCLSASTFRFNEAAAVELVEAANWYKGTRRAPVGRFPYSVVYREVTEDEIEIVALAHFKKRPRYWSSR